MFKARDGMHRPLQGWCPRCNRFVTLDERGRALHHFWDGGDSGPSCKGSYAQIKPPTPPITPVTPHIAMHRTDQGRLRRQSRRTGRLWRLLRILFPFTF